MPDSGDRSFSADDFVAAATRLFETAQPWFAAAIAEHVAHPAGTPGTCRLCALRSAVSGALGPTARAFSDTAGRFADDIVDDLLALFEELVATVLAATESVAADYASTMAAARPNDGSAERGSPDSGGAGDTAPPPASSYQQIAISLPNSAERGD